MKMNKRILSLLLTAVILMGSCNSSRNLTQNLPESDCFEIKKGDTFEIKFVTNASTGYTWVWSNNEAVQVVDSVGDRYVNNAPPGVAGASVNRYWAFQGVKKGTDTLKFEYCRLFQPNSTIKTRNVIVKVK